MAFDLRNGTLSATVIELGAVLQALRCPDAQGRIADVTLGFDTLEPYVASGPYFGAVVGRFANRIARGRFALDGRTIELACNDGPNHLHGGTVGFDKRLWRGETVNHADGPTVRFKLESPDGEEGYPGAVAVTATYTLTNDALQLELQAVAEAPTVINLAHHAYFNLAGHDFGSVLDHVLQLEADSYTPVDASLIPEGPPAPVTGTPFEFRAGKSLGAEVNSSHDQIRRGQGYDHNLVLRGRGFRRVASLAEPTSGRRLAVWTDQPGLQLYTGNHLDGVSGKDGARYGRRSGVCLETQHFPDSPNRADFPSTRCDPETPFRSRTTFRFGTD